MCIIEKTSLKVILVSTLLVFLIGCASLNTSIKPNTSFSNIKSFTVETNNDPLGVKDKITQRIMTLGFNVVETGDYLEPASEQIVSATGTGFIITRTGYILTNYHIVENANSITTQLVSGETHKAIIVQKDPSNDIALLKVTGKPKFTFWMPLDDSVQAKMGENIYTLGFPLTSILGEKPRITDGIISSIYGLNNDPRIFQITAPLQPGNSGGPLINSTGKVIGITMSTLDVKYLYKETGTLPQNINFAIKINYAKNLADMEPNIKLESSNFSGLDIDDLLKGIVLIKAELVAPTMVRKIKGNPDVIVKFNYGYEYDVFHYTFTSFNMRFIDSRTGEVILTSSFSGASPLNVDGILNQVFEDVERKINRVSENAPIITYPRAPENKKWQSTTEWLSRPCILDQHEILVTLKNGITIQGLVTECSDNSIEVLSGSETTQSVRWIDITNIEAILWR